MLTLKENIQIVTWKRVHRVKKTNALVCVDMDAAAGNTCAGTVAFIRAAKITTFAVVTIFTQYRASHRFRISGSLVMRHMNAEDM